MEFNFGDNILKWMIYLNSFLELFNINRIKLGRPSIYKANFYEYLTKVIGYNVLF